MKSTLTIAEFEKLADAAARRYAQGPGRAVDLHRAVDSIFARAVISGLATEIGVDAVQAIMGAAFARRRKDL